MPEISVSKKQIEFLKSKSKGTIFRGGIRSGKTIVLCMVAVIKALRGRRQLIVSFSYRMLKDVVMHTMTNVVLPMFGLTLGVDYRVADKTITLRNGTEILLRSGDDPGSIRGLSVADVYIDEAREFKTDEIFLVCLGRISDYPDGQWYISSSPRGKDWVYDLYESDKDTINLIVQRTVDNPFITQEYIDELKKRYPSKYAAQELGAEIIEMGAGVIDPEWFTKIDGYKSTIGVRAWDLAVSIKTSADYTAGVLCSMSNGILYIRDIIRDKFEYPELKKKIISTAKYDGIDVYIGIEEAGQMKGYIDDLKRNTVELMPYVIKSVPPWGDKLNRALPWISRAESGCVKMVRAPWNKEFEDECRDFTSDMTHKHDDMIDAVSMAYHMLARNADVTAGNVRF
jgi:predicted phage terminase large subunit-like protein